MMSLVLQQLEKLRAELALVDPANQTDAAEKVAAMAVALRNTIAPQAHIASPSRMPRKRSRAA